VQLEIHVLSNNVQKLEKHICKKTCYILAYILKIDVKCGVLLNITRTTILVTPTKKINNTIISTHQDLNLIHRPFLHLTKC
jgi:hypothetical protein